MITTYTRNINLQYSNYGVVYCINKSSIKCRPVYKHYLFIYKKRSIKTINKILNTISVASLSNVSTMNKMKDIQWDVSTELIGYWTLNNYYYYYYYYPYYSPLFFSGTSRHILS